MNIYHIGLISYILITGTAIDLALSWPILNPKNDSYVKPFLFRVMPTIPSSRQVVQPSWLNFGQTAVIDPVVHVNSKALSEAEEIRKDIQKAVDEDTYAVTDDQSDFITTTEAPLSTPHDFPNWYQQFKNFWHNMAQNLFKVFRN